MAGFTVLNTGRWASSHKSLVHGVVSWPVRKYFLIKWFFGIRVGLFLSGLYVRLLQPISNLQNSEHSVGYECEAY